MMLQQHRLTETWMSSTSLSNYICYQSNFWLHNTNLVRCSLSVLSANIVNRLEAHKSPQWPPKCLVSTNLARVEEYTICYTYESQILLRNQIFKAHWSLLTKVVVGATKAHLGEIPCLPFSLPLIQQLFIMKPDLWESTISKISEYEC